MSKSKNKNDKKAEKTGLGARLHEALGSKGYKETARMLEKAGLRIDYDSLRRYILEERKPDIDMLLKLADVSDVSTEWLLRGHDKHSESINSTKFIDLTEDLNEVIWSELTCGDLKALQKLAERNNSSIQKTVRELIVQGLKVQGVLESPHKINFLALSDYSDSDKDLCEIELLGEIDDQNELIKLSEVIKIPKKIVAGISRDTEKPFSLRNIHSYRIISKQLRTQKIHEGDFIVTADFKTVVDDNDWYFDSLAFVYKSNDREILLRRIYKDNLNRNGFLLSPLYTPHPIERSSTLRFESLEFILAVVTP